MTLDELAGLTGTELGLSAWHPVTQEMVATFAELTGDTQWIHTDPDRATRGPYGHLIAHGVFILALVPTMTLQVLGATDSDLVINKGFGRVRLSSPVPVGSRVRGVVHLTATRPRPRGFHETTLTITVQTVTGETALTAELILLLLRQGDAAATAAGELPPWSGAR